MKLKYDVVIPSSARGVRNNSCGNLIKQFAKSEKGTAEVLYRGTYKNASSGYQCFKDEIEKMELSSEIKCVVRSGRLFLIKKGDNDE